LFEGHLPEFNLGTHNGSTCDPKIEQSAIEVYSEAEGYSSVLNGRFKGGWTTRHYADTANEIHTIQLELAQRTYMDEFSPWIYREERSLKIRIHLKKLLSCLEQLISSFT
jgi:formiminoglutamase